MAIDIPDFETMPREEVIILRKRAALADELAAALESVLDGLGALCNHSELDGLGLTQDDQAQVWAALAKHKKAKGR